ncbi:MAG: hypothetical protein AB8F65_08455 [Woeseiaceae bacterium]
MKARFQSYLNNLFKQPVIEKFQTPLRRRLVATSMILWQMVVVGAMYLIQFDLIWPVIVAGIVMIYLMSMTNMATRGVFELVDEHLDEFQIAIRDAAYRKAYFFALLWLLLVAPFFGFVEGHEKARLFVFLFVLLGFFWALSAPRVLVAWTLPADEVEE